MIIGYYPGAGGNRYLNYTLGKDFAGTGAYDSKTVGVFNRGKYLVDGETLVHNGATSLLHCVNYTRIHEHFPDEADVVIIKTDLKTSLSREWSIKGKNKPMFYPNDNEFIVELYNNIRDSSWPKIDLEFDIDTLPEYIQQELSAEIHKNRVYIDTQGTFNYLSAAYTSICWHNDLYQQWPFEAGAATVIDIENDSTEFAQVIRNELAQHTHNELFNFAWETFEQHGANAPIIDLYNQHVR